MKRLWITLGLIAGVALAVVYAAYIASKFEDDVAWSGVVTGGDRRLGPALMQANGCAGCHDIPGVPGASGTTGPALAGLARRPYLAGSLPNQPEVLVNWIRHAREMKPGTAMPSTRVPEQSARDIAAYLYDPCRTGLLTGRCY